MPRVPTHFIPGVVYHLISRFVAREFFITCELDRRAYVELLGRALSRTAWRCLGYAVMSNHIHLAVVAGADPLAAWLRLVHSPFADAVNRTRQRIGAIFVRGPKAILVPDSGAARLIGYIHNNPVRAGVSAHPRDSVWTSHRAYVGLDTAPAWLDVEEGLRRAQVQRGEDFERVVAAAADHPVLGRVESDKHLAQLVDAYERARWVELRAHACRPTVSARHLATVVTGEIGLPLAQLRSGRRGAREVLGRSVVIACGVRVGCSTREIADALAITPQAVTKALREGRSSSEAEVLVERIIAELAIDGR